MALLGLVFNSEASLSDAFRGGAFIGEHGSWDRSPMSGYKVVDVPFKDGRPAGQLLDVVTGFLSADDHVNGRPVGLAIDRTGDLLIADDVGNTAWRVTASGHG